MNLKKQIIFSGYFLLLQTPLWAGYTITRTPAGNDTLLVQGKEYDYRVTNTDTPRRFEDVFIEVGGTVNYDIFVPPGVQTGANKYAVDSNGELVFTIRFHTPGSFSLTAKNAQFTGNLGTLSSIQVQKYPTTFAITPNNPTVNSNVSFNINITALDSNGVTVTAFEDPVQVVDSQLGDVTFVSGTNFTNGQANNVAVNVKAADLNNQFTLTLTMVGQQYYDPTLPAPSLVARATKVTNPINLIPGAFSKLVMLFPGQILQPGVGKVGTILDQQSGVPVSLVTVRRVDSFFNPILTNPASAINVQFTSSAGGVDTPPFPFTLSMTGPLLSISAAMNQIYFGGSGDRVVKATPDGDTSKEDSTTVPVTPGSAESYVITLLNVAPGATKQTNETINMEIQAKDQNGDDLTTLFGVVPGAVLTVQYAGSLESASWVDTAPGDLIPQNVVNFVAGKATVNLVVTKFGFDAKLRYAAPSSPVAESITFNVDVGPATKVHLTVVGKHPTPTQGQTWTPGTYPGNSGWPPVVTAGEEIIVEARVTDDRWNLVAGGGPHTMQLVNDNPVNYIEGSNPILTGPIYTFPANGELRYDANPAFDKAFRVRMRTAGPSALVPAPRVKTQTSLSVNSFFGSTMTVLPGAYSKMVLVVPGETIRPGIDTEADGKEGSPTSSPRTAGAPFTVTAYATDQYFNPLVNGPFPSANFSITPVLAGSFFSGSLPQAMASGSRNFTLTLQSDSDVQLFDNAIPGRNQTVAIPVAHGAVHHYTMMLTDPADKEAGVPFNVTIRAEDQFDNVVSSYSQVITLSATTGAGTMSPSNVTLTNGVFNGDITMFAAGPSVRVNMVRGTVNSQSAAFVVKTNPLGYRRLLLILSGETMAPGTAAGKVGTPTEVTVGSASVVRAIACDLHYNPISATGIVQLTSDRYAAFGGITGSLAPVSGHGEYSTSMVLRTASTHTITVLDVNLDGTIARSTSTILAKAGSYKKLQFLAPGEVADPGTTVPTGKTAATPSTQKAGVPFTMTIRAVDDFWNVVSFSGGDIQLDPTNSDYLYNPPNNMPGNTGVRAFTNGIATREVIIGQQGLFNITATDQANLTRPGQTVQVQVNPGPVYVINVASSVVAGQEFSATITLEEGGVPLVGANHSISLTATLAAGGAGSGTFDPGVYTMTDGVVNIPASGPQALAYSYVERIKIRVTDNFNRVGFSNTIEVVPSGLKYRVIVPTQAVAGPPSNFNVTVELLDQNEDTLVKNHDHQIRIDVRAVNPPTTGIYTVTSANLSQGMVVFQQFYSKAEAVEILVSESTGSAGDPNYVIPSKTSNVINIRPDGYKKLLVLAPGETHVPGVPSSTGKTGAAFVQQLSVPFLMQVRGVDQYWNVADDFNGGTIRFESSDIPPSLGPTNPSNQNVPLVNGESASNITLNNPGNVFVTVRDDANSSIGIQSVQVTVGGNIYEITVPAEVMAGPPSNFDMSVVLKDAITGNIVTGTSHTFDIYAMLPDGTTAQGSLGITEGNLASGIANITGQTYSIAEDIFIRIIERTNNTIRSMGNSPIIHVIPRQVRYDIFVPTRAEVNVAFSVTVRAIDQDTGTPVKNLNRTNALSALSAGTGLPVTGSFVPNAVNIVNGVGDISATYNRTEIIFLQMTDNTPFSAPSAPTQAMFTSQGSIDVRPGPMASIDVTDFQLQSNQVATFTFTARDAHGNPIALQTLRFEMQSMEQGHMGLNGNIDGLIQQTNGQGAIFVTFDPSDDANGIFDMVVRDGDRVNGFSQAFRITVLGFPRLPAQQLGDGDELIPLNYVLKLDLTRFNAITGEIRTYYSLDGGPEQLYNPAVGITGFTELRRYRVEYYSIICYDVACSNPVSEKDLNGGSANVLNHITFNPDGKLAGFPSPFNPTKAPGYMTLTYNLPVQSGVEIDIYDLFGQKVWHKDIEAGQNGGTAGQHDNTVLWYGTNESGVTVANGGYIVTVKVGATGQTMKSKILVVK